MSLTEKTWQEVERVLADSGLAILATEGANGPACGLLAIALAEEPRCVVFATERDTEKFRNLAQDPRASFLIDDRMSAEGRIAGTTSVRLDGTAAEATGARREELIALLAATHPDLEDFFRADECVVLECGITDCEIVRSFRQAGPEGG